MAKEFLTDVDLKAGLLFNGVAVTAAGKALLDDADAAAQRTTLGLGTLATQSGTFSGTSSGTNTGDQTITLTGDVTGSGTGSFAATLANTGTAGTYTKVTTDAKGRVSSGTTLSSADIPTLGNITNAGAIGSTANLPIITTTSGVLTTGSFGTTANTFCQGNDSRLSDTRNTTNAVTFNNGGAGAASGSTFNGSAAVTVSYNTVGAPSTTGANASGSWGISITGSAATLTTARTLTIGDTGKTFNGSANVSWTTDEIGAAHAGAGGAIIESKNSIAANYTLTTNYNGISAGPVTINSGVTVTVPSGASWVIV